ncbi:MAG TPA: hypothetical protein VGI81_03830 [Tepidisphaeraceae bacterium]
MAWTKGKTAAVTILVALLIGGGGAVVVYRVVSAPSERRVIAMPGDGNSSAPAIQEVPPAYPQVARDNQPTPPPATTPASQPGDDAWPLYQRAIARVEEGYRRNIMCPAASPLAFGAYPPYPAAWQRLETASYAFNAPARELAHEARSLNIAHWPVLRGADGKVVLPYLNGCRALANEVGDAAFEEHALGNHAAAVERVRDLLHLADLLDDRAEFLIQPLVALGVRLVATDRLEVITADVKLTADPADTKKLQLTAASELIRELFDTKDPAAAFAGVLRREAAAGQFTTEQRDRFVVQLHRGQMEQNLAAMALACHLFRFDHHRWPASIEEVTACLPAPPVDAWGPMGYVLVKPAPPGGPERPLVYSRCNSKDGLFYPTDGPQHSWYPGFGAGRTRKQGGQFRDVSLWVPPRPNPGPTTRPLPG